MYRTDLHNNYEYNHKNEHVFPVLMIVSYQLVNEI